MNEWQDERDEGGEEGKGPERAKRGAQREEVLQMYNEDDKSPKAYIGRSSRCYRFCNSSSAPHQALSLSQSQNGNGTKSEVRGRHNYTNEGSPPSARPLLNLTFSLNYYPMSPQDR